MNMIYEIDKNISQPRGYELIWDGKNYNGHKVANGPYFYSIKTPDNTINGKILLIE